jgi:hypothetical protein
MDASEAGGVDATLDPLGVRITSLKVYIYKEYTFYDV